MKTKYTFFIPSIKPLGGRDTQPRAKKVLEHGFKAAEVEAICGGCAKENIGSKKVLEKIGMKRLDDGEDGLFQYHMTSGDYAGLYGK